MFGRGDHGEPLCQSMPWLRKWKSGDLLGGVLFLRERNAAKRRSFDELRVSDLSLPGATREAIDTSILRYLQSKRLDRFMRVNL